MIDLKWVQDRLRLIESGKLDDEAAHSHEDDLYVEVLQAVAAGHPDAAVLASEALKTRDIDFGRWCA